MKRHDRALKNAACYWPGLATLLTTIFAPEEEDEIG